MIKLKVENISKSYKGINIIKDVSLELSTGETICLLGASGVGKTTLFNIISGLTKPDHGTVLLNDTNITGKPGNTSYMLQKDLLLPYFNVLNNVSLPLVIRGIKKNEARERAQEYFSQFGLLGAEDKYPCQISGGMRQRAALLRTYMFSREVMLLDEPFSALDAITRSKMQKWFLDVIKQMGTSTILITHDVDEAILLSNRIYIMAGEPGTITREIKVDKRVDINEEFFLTNEFIKYKRLVLKSI